MKKQKLDLQPKPSRTFAEIQARVSGFTFKTILDVGANIGQSAISYSISTEDCDIYSFEPIKKTYEELLKNTAGYPRVKAHNFGLGERSDTLRALSDGTSASNRIVHAESEGQSYEDVSVVPGELFCRDNGIDHVSFLKIDTEGHDMSVLRGFDEFLRNIDFIQVEASLNPQNTLHVPYRELEDYVRARGFLIFKIYGQTFEFHGGGRPYARRGDFVFINEKLARPL